MGMLMPNRERWQRFVTTRINLTWVLCTQRRKHIKRDDLQVYAQLKLAAGKLEIMS